MLGNYRMAAQVVASRAVLSFTELVSYELPCRLHASALRGAR
jgi:hypothetical protein